MPIETSYAIVTFSIPYSEPTLYALLAISINDLIFVLILLLMFIKKGILVQHLDLP